MFNLNHSQFDLLAFNHDGTENKVHSILDSTGVLVSINKCAIWVDNGDWRLQIKQNRMPLMNIRDGNLLIANTRVSVSQYTKTQAAVFLLVQYLRNGELQYFSGIGAYGYADNGTTWTGIRHDTWNAYIDWLKEQVDKVGHHTSILNEFIENVKAKCPRSFGTRAVIHLPDTSKIIDAKYSLVEDTVKIIQPAAPSGEVDIGPEEPPEKSSQQQQVEGIDDWQQYCCI